MHVAYGWKLGGRWHSLTAQASPHAHDIAPGSEEEFITEHYWGYTKRANGSTSAYGVQHPHWQIYPIRSCEVTADFGMLYGGAFSFLNDQPVASVLLAEGSAVSVHQGFRL